MKKSGKTLHRRLLLLVALSVLSFVPLAKSGAQESDSSYRRLYDFLAGYLENDLELQKLSLTAESARLSLKSTQIDKGIDLSLSSGTVTLYSIDGKSYIDMEPSASLELPALNGTSVNASLPISIDDGEKTLSNGSLSLSTDIIGSTARSRSVTLMEAERALVEARRDVADRALNAEKDFYTQLKTLYGYAVTVLEKKSDLYDDDTTLRKLVAQGYSQTSSTYRTAYLTVQSDRRDVAEAQRKLERETAIFARKCGLDYQRSESAGDDSPNESEQAYRSALAFLPFAVPEVEGIDALSFDQESYAESESARWDKQIGALKRAADGDITLKASAEYTFNYTNTSARISSDTAGGGLSLEWKGLSAYAGVALPTGTSVLGMNGGASPTTEKTPVYKFSIGLSPAAFRQARIDREQDKLDMQLEDIALQTAADDYETDMLDRQTSLGDLEWARQSYSEEYDMYATLEKDMAEWYRQGIITASDYYDARDNRDKAALNLLINAVEYIIYNNETKLLFRTDGEGGGEKSE